MPDEEETNFQWPGSLGKEEIPQKRIVLYSNPII